MGVRLLSSIFGKNPSPSPTSDGSPPSPAPTKSPVAKTRLGSLSKEPTEAESRKPEHPTNEVSPSEEASSSKRAAVPTKLGIGVGGNVLAEMKARQERRISGIMKQNSNEESDFSEKSEAKTEPISKSSSLSPNPLGGIRLRPTPPTPEDQEPPKLPEKTGIRFNRSAPLDDSESKNHPLAGIRLRPRGGSEETEVPATKNEEKTNNVTNHFRLRAASSPAEEGSSSGDTTGEAVKTNPLSGVKLRSTGINVIDPLKSPNNDSGSAGEIKSEARNSLSKLKPPPLAPKPRPWSIVGSDKKTGAPLRVSTPFFLVQLLNLVRSYPDDSENTDAAKENDAKEAIKSSKVRAMAANLNSSNTGKRIHHFLLLLWLVLVCSTMSM